MAGRFRRGRLARLRASASSSLPVKAPHLPPELRQSLVAATDGGVVTEWDYAPMLNLCDLGLVVRQSRQGDECRYVATAEGRRVAAALATGARAA